MELRYDERRAIVANLWQTRTENIYKLMTNSFPCLAMVLLFFGFAVLCLGIVTLGMQNHKLLVCLWILGPGLLVIGFALLGINKFFLPKHLRLLVEELEAIEGTAAIGWSEQALESGYLVWVRADSRLPAGVIAGWYPICKAMTANNPFLTEAFVCFGSRKKWHQQIRFPRKPTLKTKVQLGVIVLDLEFECHANTRAYYRPEELLSSYGTFQQNIEKPLQHQLEERTRERLTELNFEWLAGSPGAELRLSETLDLPWTPRLLEKMVGPYSVVSVRVISARRIGN